MERVGIRDLKQNASAVVRRVAAGEPIEVTDRGRPVAKIVPLRPGLDPMQRLIDEGQVEVPTDDRDFLEIMDEMELPWAVEPGRPLPSQILVELRRDER